MTKVEKSVVIGAPLEKVYTFTTDWRNIERYFVYVRSVKLETEHAIGEGARLSLKIKFLGLPLASAWEGIEHIENVGWAFNAKLLGRNATKRWRFAPMNGSTRVTFTLEYKPFPPLIGRIMDVILIKPQWTRLYDQSFEKLKRVIETET